LFSTAQSCIERWVDFLIFCFFLWRVTNKPLQEKMRHLLGREVALSWSSKQWGSTPIILMFNSMDVQHSGTFRWIVSNLKTNMHFSETPFFLSFQIKTKVWLQKREALNWLSKPWNSIPVELLFWKVQQGHWETLPLLVVRFLNSLFIFLTGAALQVTSETSSRNWDLNFDFGTKRLRAFFLFFFFFCLLWVTQWICFPFLLTRLGN
jgi:hypothetical protein